MPSERLPIDEDYLQHLECAWETVRNLSTKAAADTLMLKLMLSAQPQLIAEIRRLRALLPATDGAAANQDEGDNDDAV